MEATPKPIEPGGEMGLGAKLANVFFSPAATFESIARRPGWDWLVPVLLILVLGVAGAFVIAPKIDVDDAVRIQMERMEKAQPGMSGADRERIEETSRKSMTAFTQGPLRFVGPLVGVVPVFLVPLFYLGVSAAWGKAGRYLAILGGYAWVQMVQVLKGILMLAIGSTRDSIGIEEIEGLVKSNLGAFLDPGTASRPLFTLASSVDIFEIWAVVLGSIALSKTTRLSPKGAAATVAGLWIVWILVRTGLAAVGSAFGG